MRKTRSEGISHGRSPPVGFACQLLREGNPRPDYSLVVNRLAIAPICQQLLFLLQLLRKRGALSPSMEHKQPLGFRKAGNIEVFFNAHGKAAGCISTPDLGIPSSKVLQFVQVTSKETLSDGFQFDTRLRDRLTQERSLASY